MAESVTQIAADVRAGHRSAREVVDAALERIAATNTQVNAFVAVDEERARAQAEALDARIAAGGDPGPLAGVPIGVKDLEPAEGFVTTYGDPARRSDPPAIHDSIQVARLRGAGAIVLGKTNTPAYGFHAETDNLLFGPTRNPWALGRTSGGSSGGAAAAVAAGMVPLATGSDGGGSIRIPSEVCGLSGFKPTHGVVPAGDDAAPTWGPFSTRGPMARTFAEIALALDAVRGISQRDLLSFELAGGRFVDAVAQASLDGVRIAWSPTLGIARPEPFVVELCEAAVGILEAHGAVVVDRIDAVFDVHPGLPWSLRAGPASLRTATLDPTPWEGRFLPQAQAAARSGETISARQMVEADIGAHEAGLALARVWERADVLISPGMETVPPKVGEVSPHGLTWAASYTLPFNLVRSPAAVVVAGFADDEGDHLPIGLQIAAPRGADLALMRVAAAAEAVLGAAAHLSPMARGERTA